MECIKIENLSFSYPENNDFNLKNINLSVQDGEFITLFGVSGCGKTTLLKHLKPEITPAGNTSGEIVFYGKPIVDADSPREIGYVYQNPDHQIVCDKVWHELAFGLESTGLSQSEMRKRIAEMSAFFGIQKWMDMDVFSLSGGQKQLLNLASVMVMRPKVLILDEPCAQLDPVGAENFLHMLKKINTELGTTVILSEHRLEEAVPLSDRVIAMENGEVTAFDTPSEVGYLLKEKGSTLLSAMPTAIRVYSETEHGKNSPVTVKEGRAWLEQNKGKLKDLPINPTSNEEGEYAIEVKGVSFRYEKDGKDILNNISLAVKKGEIYAITGGNGSGKSTLLTLLSGIKKPYLGRVKTYGKVTYLPQNPQTVFTEKTVYEDLKTVNCDDEQIEKAVALCRIGRLLNRHPFDLSGGEQQRAALCKALLTSPEILLLDEPTKGMDGGFKREFKKILKELKKQAVTVVMVSHDVEFCAITADRCGLLFDGRIATEGTPREFFNGNTFYTTAASRMTRGLAENIVTAEELIFALTGNVQQDTENEEAIFEIKTEKPKEKVKKRRLKPLSWVLLGIFVICTALQWILPPTGVIPLEIVMALSFAGFFISLIQKNASSVAVISSGKKKSFSWISLLVVAVLIPVTVLLGVYAFDDRKYYFISPLVILEIFVPFLFSFEHRKPKGREVVLLAVLVALSVAGRMAFYMLPHFKPTLAIIMITGFA
ncbi:MAG: ATP-binding cassette domain-containing protein, partial [Clostridia bacterium]|nr:ATP-binding cassette domain-containing protein [Clostridia bacterium]